MTTLQELKAVLAAATPGEWKTEEYRAMAGKVARVYVKGHGDLVSGNFMYDDAHLICFMHNALPALIECAEALESAVGRLEWLNDPRTGATEGPWIKIANKALNKLKGEQSENPQV